MLSTKLFSYKCFCNWSSICPWCALRPCPMDSWNSAPSEYPHHKKRNTFPSMFYGLGVKQSLRGREKYFLQCWELHSRWFSKREGDFQRTHPYDSEKKCWERRRAVLPYWFILASTLRCHNGDVYRRNEEKIHEWMQSFHQLRSAIVIEKYLKWRGEECW